MIDAKHFFLTVLEIQKNKIHQFTNRTLLKKNVKSRHPTTYISTTIMEVNTKSSEKSANSRHMIPYKTFLTINFFSLFFFLVEKMIVNNAKMPSKEKYKNKIKRWIIDFNQFIFYFKYSHYCLLENLMNKQIWRSIVEKSAKCNFPWW